MTRDHRLQTLLDALNRYIDNMPPEGSTDHARFTALWTELLAYRPVAPDTRKARVEPVALGPEALDRGFGRRTRGDPSAETLHRRATGGHADPIRRDR